MIKITVKQLQEMNACEAGVAWFKSRKVRTLKRLIPALLKDGKSGYAFWLLPRLMTHPQKISFAIYAAEEVVDIFERRYPLDKRPRKAIQAAKDFLAGKIGAADANAAYAAANAANAADAYAAYAAANAVRKRVADYGLTLLGELK